MQNVLLTPGRKLSDQADIALFLVVQGHLIMIKRWLRKNDFDNLGLRFFLLFMPLLLFRCRLWLFRNNYEGVSDSSNSLYKKNRKKYKYILLKF